MTPENVYFTTKTAYGRAFCNRLKERDKLKSNIKKGQHTVVVAPRRYGKTSLVCQVLEESKVDHAVVDLFCTIYADAVCEKLIDGVSDLINKLMPFSTKTIHFIEQCFKSAFVAIKAGKIEIKVEFSKPKFDPVAGIIDVLTGLEKIASKQNKRVVIFIDEFQDLLKADNSDQIQAALRSVAQKAKYLCFVFSGSSRYMLKKIFDDRNQPLYMLCHKIQLERINEVDFTKHIQTAAKEKWKKQLPTNTIKTIFAVSELHPYYVNLLCYKLWSQKNLPTERAVFIAWDDCLQGQQHKLIADLEYLNANRIKVLNMVALLDEVAEPNSKNFIDKVGIPLSSIQNSVSYLLDQDYLMTSQSKSITLVDPLLKKFICERVHK